MNRRNWLKRTAITLSAATETVELKSEPLFSPDPPTPAVSSVGTTVDKALVYRLLGFNTMTGEDPLHMWARLKNTQTWLAGPLSPDCWCGQTFIADHADIFAFRFLSIPAAWMSNAPSGNRAAYCAKNMSEWLSKWPSWWRTVGPKAPDDSYARLIWQMPQGGPEVTYEWARTGENEIVGRVINSDPADVALEAYVPWDNCPPKFSVLYSHLRR